MSSERRPTFLQGSSAPEFAVSVSFLELYRGEFYDLFNKSVN